MSNQKFTLADPLVQKMLAGFRVYMRSRFEGRAVSRSHVPSVQAALDRAWTKLQTRQPGRYYLAPGCLVTGLEFHNERGLRWLTDFDPAPRFGKPKDGGWSLGFWNQFDVWYAQDYVGVYHITLIGAKDYQTWSFRLGRYEQPQLEFAKPFYEGKRRMEVALGRGSQK